MVEVQLPVEIMAEIFTRFSVKTLSRFKCVSESWYYLISSSLFINHHIKSNSNPHFIFRRGKSLFSALIYEYIDNDNSNLNFSELNHPLKLLPTRPKVNLIESCNGIILISNYKKTRLFLYNPTNNTYRLLPPILPWSRSTQVIGLGYDSHNDDYKVIGVTQNPGVNLEICVYSMRENDWKLIKDESDLIRKHSIRRGHAVGVNGVRHFTADTIEGMSLLLCFDLKTEVLSIVDYPELECYDLSMLSESMKELSGCLCLVINYQRDCGELIYADVWEMREGGKKAPSPWVKLFRIRKSEIVGNGKWCTYLKLHAYSKDKGKVLFGVDCGLVGWYDLATKSVQKVKTHGFRDEDRLDEGMTYVESLVSVSNDKQCLCLRRLLREMRVISSQIRML